MKKLLFLLVAIIGLSSCEQDIQTNTPAFQGNKDNVLWRAKDSKVSIAADGSMTINAYSPNEVLTIKIPSSAPGTYILGLSDSFYASYTLTDANRTFHYETGLNKGNGTIVIKPSDAPGTFSGTFKFNALNEDGEVLNFNNGNFYKTPKQ
jgi:hypothetical protein